jgi:hypothetical protein
MASGRLFMVSPLAASSVAVLLSVFTLAALTGVMLVWMYATRLPAMRRAGLAAQAAAHVVDLKGALPSAAERIADNYNHLTEAPTVFYAVALGVVVMGAADTAHGICAWTYVVLRFAHSMVQATVNRVTLRFLLFSLSWVALMVMIVRAIIWVAA